VAVITSLSAHDDTSEVGDLRARIEQQLIAAAKSGRRRVPFGELFEHHGKKVFCAVHWMMRNREEGAFTLGSKMNATKAWQKNSNATDTFEFGEVKGCFSTMEIHFNGRPVTLTSKEFKTLAYLLNNPRRVISRDELLNEVWGYDSYPCTRTVDNHILKLRKKLEREPADPVHFHTVHSAGYKFMP
jgi:DNA-binding response OmpR family regulator